MAVACSAFEAEYHPMANITFDLKWLKGLLLSLGVQHQKVISLHCDSQFELHLAQNLMFHKPRTYKTYLKYMEVDIHFLRDGIINPSYIVTHVS